MISASQSEHVLDGPISKRPCNLAANRRAFPRGMRDNGRVEKCGKKNEPYAQHADADFANRGVPAATVWIRNHPEEVFYV